MSGRWAVMSVGFRAQSAEKLTIASATRTPKSVILTRKSPLNSERTIMKISEKSQALLPTDFGKNPSVLSALRWRAEERNEGTNLVSEAMTEAMPIRRAVGGSN